MKRIFIFGMLMMAMTISSQVKTDITQFNLSGPYAVAAPVAFDTVDVQGKKYDDKTLMNAMSLSSPASRMFDGQVLPSLEESRSVGLLSFYVNNSDYLKGKIEVKGPKNYKLFIDGAEGSPDLKLAPSSILLSRKTPTPSRSPLMHHGRLPIHLKPDIPIWFTTSPTASV